MRGILIIPVLLILIGHSSAIGVNTGSKADHQVELKDVKILGHWVLLEFNNILKTDDYFFMLQLGMFSDDLKMQHSFLFGIRPWERKTRVKKSKNYYYQFQERRFVLGAQTEKYFHLSERYWAGLHAGCISTFGKFAGTSIEVNGEWKIHPIMGASLLYSRPAFRVRLGYQYYPIPDAGDHHLSIGLTYPVQRPIKKKKA